jgi:cellobiose-specific phosphotransferase system component IIA
MKEIKVGIVGLGRLGSVHAQNLAFKIPGCKLVAACSLVQKELDWAKDYLKVEYTTTDYKKMVDDEKYEVAFEIIACAGDAKSLALMAIEEARNGNFEQAEKNLAEAREQMAKAHDVQNDMLQSEAQGRSVELNIVLIHAEDHLTMAIMSIDFAEEFIELYKQNHK